MNCSCEQEHSDKGVEVALCDSMTAMLEIWDRNVAMTVLREVEYRLKAQWSARDREKKGF